jgi:hypothetical protein
VLSGRDDVVEELGPAFEAVSVLVGYPGDGTDDCEKSGGWYCFLFEE